MMLALAIIATVVVLSVCDDDPNLSCPAGKHPVPLRTGGHVQTVCIPDKP